MEKFIENLGKLDKLFWITDATERIINTTSLITGFSKEFSKQFLLYTLALILIIFLFQWIKNKIESKILTKKKQLIEVYDKIVYLIAKASHIQKQRGININNENNPSLTILHSLVDHREEPNYFNSKELFKKNIKKIETSRGSTLISENNRKQIDNRHNEIDNIKILSKIMLILQISSLAYYIYLLIK